MPWVYQPRSQRLCHGHVHRNDSVASQSGTKSPPIGRCARTHERRCMCTQTVPQDATINQTSHTSNRCSSSHKAKTSGGQDWRLIAVMVVWVGGRGWWLWLDTMTTDDGFDRLSNFKRNSLLSPPLTHQLVSSVIADDIVICIFFVTTCWGSGFLVSHWHYLIIFSLLALSTSPMFVPRRLRFLCNHVLVVIVIINANNAKQNRDRDRDRERNRSIQ